MPEPTAVRAHEQHRLASVRSLGLDAGCEERFTRIARVVAQVLDVPISYIALMEADRQVYKGCVGFDPPPAVPRSGSFCEQTIAAGRRLVVPDLTADDRFRDSHYVTEDEYRFYAGEPLRVDGHVVGTLCALDRRPREITSAQESLLAEIAAWAVAELVAAELAEVLERVRAGAAQLAAVQQRDELILQFADQPLYGVDAQGIVTFANPAAARLLREEPKELVGVHFHDTYHHTAPDGRAVPWEECPSHDVVSKGVRRRVVNDVLHLRDGSTVEIEFSSAPLVVHGDVTGAVVSLHDIGKRRAVERLKDEFVSVVSHELRTPLTSVRGSLGLLASGRFGDIPPKASRLVDLALSNTERLVRLVNDILDLERIEAGKLELQCSTGPLAPVLEAARDGVIGLAEEAGVDIRISGAEVSSSFDRDLLVRALVNLVGNAVKFTPEGGRVEMAAFVAGAEVHIDVRDTGRGIPADRLGRIFERFEQVDASDTRKKGGTGLGLAITRSIVERHGGRIAVRSELGHGSTFTISLPAPKGLAMADPGGQR